MIILIRAMWSAEHENSIIGLIRFCSVFIVKVCAQTFISREERCKRLWTFKTQKFGLVYLVFRGKYKDKLSSYVQYQYSFGPELFILVVECDCRSWLLIFWHFTTLLENFGIVLQLKHRKNSECCPGHYLIVNHYSSMSWFKFRNLSLIVNCVIKSLNH